MSSSLALLTHFILFIPFTSAVLTPSEIDELRVEILNAIDVFHNAFTPAEDKPLAAHIVRLVFHDCAGPENEGTTVDTANIDKRLCDGCIHSDLGDHRGIDQMAIQPLEPIYAKYQSRISRADFWAATGNIALEYTASLSPKPETLPTLPYYFGRLDCPLSPNGMAFEGDTSTKFPLAHLGWDPAFTFFRDQLGLTLRETTAVFGAHTIGKMHAVNSGFSGQWTKHPAHFDNEYFEELFDVSNEWDQTREGTNGEFPQWHNAGRAANETELVMLNSDYCLLVQMEAVDIDTGIPFLNENTGDVSCRARGFGLYRAPQCPLEVSFNRVRDYALNNELFYRDFVKGWNKIVTNNQPNLTEIIPNEFVDRRASAPPIDNVPVQTTIDGPTIHHPTTESPIPIRTTILPPQRTTQQTLPQPIGIPAPQHSTTPQPVTAIPTETLQPTTTQQPTTQRPTTQLPTIRPTTEAPVTFHPTRERIQRTRPPTAPKIVRTPSDSPSSTPTDSPLSTGAPTSQPSPSPSRFPTDSPLTTGAPASPPSANPSSLPTNSPLTTRIPTSQPSTSPSSLPTGLPLTGAPTSQPSANPTSLSTDSPLTTNIPTSQPNASPSSLQTEAPIQAPSGSPTVNPTTINR